MKKLILATAAAISLVSISTFADSGEGRSGPDQSGVSVPVRADRGLKEEDFRLAVSRCGVPVQQSLLEQLSMRSNSDLTSKESYVSIVSPNHSEQLNWHIDVGTFTSGSFTPTSRVQLFMMPTTSERQNTKRVEVSNELYEMLERSSGPIKLSTSLVAYEASADVIENVFGISNAKSGNVVTSITLAGSSRFQDGNYNLTNLVYDSRPFIQCIHNAIGE